jgi:hypothetical protein
MEHNNGQHLDAARALLGVSPSSVSHPMVDAALIKPSAEDGTAATVSSSSAEDSSSFEAPVTRRPRSNSAGLDALAFLAEKEQATMGGPSSSDKRSSSPRRFVPLVVHNAPSASASAVSSSCSSSSGEEDNDMEAMPPPPPRRIGRRRSMSNPEGMGKWHPKDMMSSSANRFQLVLPTAILEEELAEASAAMKARKEEEDSTKILPPPASKPRGRRAAKSNTSSEEEEEEEVDESKLEPAELLRRARSRLLEDLSEVNNMNSDSDGDLVLPHCLPKYREVSLSSSIHQNQGSSNQGVHHTSHLFSLLTGLQHQWTHWNLHPCRTCCYHCPLPRKAIPSCLEQEDPIQLPQESC